MIPETTITWNELGTLSSKDVLEAAIVDMERGLHEQGWEEGAKNPVQLGVVYLNVMDRKGSVEINILGGIPEAVVNNPLKGLPIMIQLLIRDIYNDEPVAQWLDETVKGNGFLGFLLILQGPPGADNPSRNLMFYSRSHGILFVDRTKQGDEVAWDWMPEHRLEDGDINENFAFFPPLIKLTELGHFLRIGHQLFGQPEDAASINN